MKNMLDVMTGGRVMPAGCDSWAMRSVHPDLRSSHGFRWPFPGNWAECDFDGLTTNVGGCPQHEGDGVCAATTYAGMASGGIPAITLLLCAYISHDVLGSESGKFRAARILVVDVIDGVRLLRESGSSANLRGANLFGANLRSAKLFGADLSYANLRRANLRHADLRRADLRCADLVDANLRDANLTGANLYGANLTGANLTGANLTGANLRGAYLSAKVSE